MGAHGTKGGYLGRWRRYFVRKPKILNDGEVARPYYLCLSVRQPWAFAIAHLGKDRENRSWQYTTKYRGPLLIQASCGCTRNEYNNAIAFMYSRGILRTGEESAANFAKPMAPKFETLQMGGIVARAHLADIVDHWEDGHAFQPNKDKSKVCVNCGVGLLTASTRQGLCSKPNRWQMDSQVGLVLKDVEPLPFVAWKGALGLFHVDKEEYDAALLNSMGAVLRDIATDSRRQAQSRIIAGVTLDLQRAIAGGANSDHVACQP